MERMYIQEEGTYMCTSRTHMYMLSVCASLLFDIYVYLLIEKSQKFCICNVTKYYIAETFKM